MTSLSSSMAEKMAPKFVAFKYQGAPKKSRFQDGYTEIRDAEVGYMN